MQQQVVRNQAPKTIDRVDSAKPPGDRFDHVHFKDGHALYNDGTWKHGGRALTNAEKTWLLANGWPIPA